MQMTVVTAMGPPSKSGASCPMAAATISAATATGPTMRRREEPKNAYTSIGAKQAYKPAWGGRPAKKA